jgi:hypothetical protein
MANAFDVSAPRNPFPIHRPNWNRWQSAKSIRLWHAVGLWVTYGLNQRRNSDHLAEGATMTETIGAKVLAALKTSFQLENIDHRSSASIGATLFMGIRL